MTAYTDEALLALLKEAYRVGFSHGRDDHYRGSDAAWKESIESRIGSESWPLDITKIEAPTGWESAY